MKYTRLRRALDSGLTQIFVAGTAVGCGSGGSDEATDGTPPNAVPTNGEANESSQSAAPTNGETDESSPGQSEPGTFQGRLAPGQMAAVECRGTVFFERMQLPESYDYLAVRVQFHVSYVGGEVQQSETLQLRLRCSGADADSECFAHHGAPTEYGELVWCRPGFICSPAGVIATRGNDAMFFGDDSSVLEFLGRIDTIEEAQLWAGLHGYYVVCNDSTFREIDGGYEFVGIREVSPCPQTNGVFWVSVAPDGTLEVLDEELVVEGTCH